MKKSSLKQLRKECDDFNTKYPIGTPVMLKKDFVDEPVETTVRHPAEVLGRHCAVAWFNGVSGCYLIDRVSV
jgi:hypothetical protein